MGYITAHDTGLKISPVPSDTWAEMDLPTTSMSVHVQSSLRGGYLRWIICWQICPLQKIRLSGTTIQNSLVIHAPSQLKG